MNETPRSRRGVRTPGTPGTIMASPPSSLESPMITVKDYTQQVDELKTENFTLKMLIWEMMSSLDEEKASALKKQFNDIVTSKGDQSSFLDSTMDLFEKDEEIGRLNEKIEQLEAEIEELKDKVTNRENQIWILENENDELKANDMTNEVQRLLLEREDAQEREMELKMKIEELEKLVVTRNDADVIEQLTRAKSELQEQVDILAQENRDLGKEIDSLRQLPRDSIGTSPAQIVFRGSQAHESFHMSPVHNVTPEKVGAGTSPGRGSFMSPARQSPIKNENEKLKQMNRELRDELNKEIATKKYISDSLMKAMDKYAENVALQVEDKIKQIEKRVADLLRKMLTMFRAERDDIRYDVEWFQNESHTMFEDIRKGAVICIQGSENFIKLMEKKRGPLSKEDRVILTRLQKEWKSQIRGWLGDYISKANELSMLISTSPLKRDDSQRIAQQCQLLIHAIWTVLGEESEEPDVSSLNTFGIRFESIIKTVIEILECGVTDLKKQIEELNANAEEVILSSSGKVLCPAVVNLVRMVTANVKMASQRLHKEHRELMVATGHDSNFSDYSVPMSRDV